jgi:hypothetical protein
MSKFRPKLARINNLCCEQVMPVAVIPICAISCEIPRPIIEISLEPQYCPIPTYSYPQHLPQIHPYPQQHPYPQYPPYLQQQLQQPAQQPQQQQENIECSSCQNNISQTYTIPNYYPGINVKIGSILTNTTGTIPNGYLLCDGSEISKELYPALFEEIGFNYGEGNGSDTFTLPNLSDTNSNINYIIKI